MSARAARALLAALLLARSSPALCQVELDVPMDRDLESVKLLFGLNTDEPSEWEGTYSVAPGRIVATDGWRFMRDDTATLEDFSLQVGRYYPRFFARNQRDETTLPVEPNGVILTLAGVQPGSVLTVATSHGDFTVPVGRLEYGTPVRALERTVEAERVPTHRLVVRGPTEDGYPAAVAQANGGIAVAYVAFTHGEGFMSRPPIPEAPTDFSFLAEPVGGDQLMFTQLRDGAWSEPVALTPGAGDLYRPQVAVDGEGRIWAFWSENDGGNWDVMGRALSQGEWSDPIRISRNPGADLNVAATTDASGRVWLAWQALTDESSDIHAACLDGDDVTRFEAVAETPANEWMPALAAATDGRVAVAWDTYARGSYDVEVRIQRDGQWGEPLLVAGSLENEARPSLAYDADERLWITYEVCPEGWGKDFGPYDQAPTRTSLYRARRIGLMILDGERWLVTPADVNQALPMPDGGRRWPNSQDGFLLSGPRVATDGTGRVYLSARVRVTRFESQVGGTWVDFVATPEGEEWRASFVVPGTDSFLHDRPALVPADEGGLYVVSTSDGRWRTAATFGPNTQQRRRRTEGLPPASTRTYGSYQDWQFNQEISVADTGVLPAPGAVSLVEVDAPVPEGPSEEALAEARQIAAIRSYRAEADGEPVRLWRGEFHRHTEVSGDGPGDGSLMDMWRYGMDMAGLDWIGNGDHDNGGGRELSWWITQKTTSMFQIPGVFTPMYTYERSVSYPDGHRNAVFAERGIRPLARLQGGTGKAMDDLPAEAERPNTPDTQMFYAYLHQFGGICASHTSGTDMGTDWRDNDPVVEPVVEIYQGDRQNYERPGAPRSNNEDYSLGGWRPYGFVSLALKKGYRLGFQSSSDHISTHMSYCNVWVEEPSRENIVKAMRQRHVYGATDNIIADVRSGEHFMGDEFSVSEPPAIHVKLIGTAPFAEVVVVKDDEYVYSTQPDSAEVEFVWTDNDLEQGKTSYYYIRGTQVGETETRRVRSLATGEQVDVELNNGEIVWVSPMWITYE